MPGLGIQFPSNITETSSSWDGHHIFNVHNSCTAADTSHVTTQDGASLWLGSIDVSHAQAYPSSQTESYGDLHSSWHSASPADSRVRYQIVTKELFAALEEGLNDSPTFRSSQCHNVLAEGSPGESFGVLAVPDPTEDKSEPLSPIASYEQSRPTLSDFATPRKAPLPPSPMLGGPVITESISRKASLRITSQSMLKTLSGRKKRTQVPPPLDISASATAGAPANCQNSSHGHQPDLMIPPSTARSGKSSASPVPDRKSPSRKASDQTHRSSTSKTPLLGSFSTFLKGIRKSVSSDDSKKSPRVPPSSSLSVPKLKQSKSISRAAPSPVIRRSGTLSGKTSKSSDANSRNSHAGRVRPVTAPSDRTTFPQGGLCVPSPALTESHLSIARSKNSQTRTPTFEIDYSLWGPTYTAAATYAPPTPLSPSQPAGLVRTQEREPQTEAMLYKQEYLRRSCQNMAGDLFHFSAPTAGSKPNSSQKAGARPTPPLIAVPAPSISSVPPLHPPRSNSFLTVTTDSEARTPSLSPSQTASLTAEAVTRRLSKVNIADRQAEQETCPHLYFAVAGGKLSLRNPFAASDGDTEQPPKPRKSSRRKTKLSTSRIPAPKLEDSEKAEWLVDYPTEENKCPTSPESGYNQSPNPESPTPQQAIVSRSSPIIQANWAEVRPPRPVFRDSFSAKSITRTTARSEYNYATSSKGTNSIPAPPFLREGRHNSSDTSNRSGAHKATWNGDYTPRRPSVASAFSNSSYPTKPTRLEVRRRTDISGSKGIRVSLDADFLCV